MVLPLSLPNSGVVRCCQRALPFRCLVKRYGGRRRGAERFVLSASDRAGQQSLDLAFAVLTWGLSELIAMPDTLCQLMEGPKA